MSTKFTGLAAASMVAILLISGMAGLAAAEPETEDPLDRIRLEQGTSDDLDGHQYVAVNMTKDDSTAVFGVSYGTEDNPGPVTLWGFYLRYLGGAEVVDENGGMMAPAVPIPVMTVFAQSLVAVAEFNDTGRPTFLNGRTGADNGVFDFTANNRVGDLDAFDIRSCEPVYKILSLETAWELSEIEETVDAANGTKYYDFSLAATDLTYDLVFDGLGSHEGTVEDGVVERIEFVFHVEANAREMEADVPFYQVTLDGNNEVVSSTGIDPRQYTGVAVNAGFKYDHIIQGWDYTSRSNTSKLMLENVVFFGTFVPDVVRHWMDAQFMEGIDHGMGVAEYETLNGTVEADDAEDIPQGSQMVRKNNIEFTDNWERVGRLTWVSNVTVDGQEETMQYQVQAGERDCFRGEEDDGDVKAIAILGGYIYPAGEDIYHDPLFEAGSIMLPFEGEGLGGIVAIAIGGAVVACSAAIVAVLLVRRRDKRMDRRMHHHVPPQHRR